MPIYEYRCEACGMTFEKLVRRSDSGAPRCPACQSPRVRKLLSVCSFTSDSGKSSAGSSCDGCAATSCATCGK